MSKINTGKLRVGVVGCGQWGPNQIRSFMFHPDSTTLRVCDKDAGRLRSIQTLYPNIEVASDYKDITESPDIDAVVVTTPVSSHYEITKSALLNGKDVLCEKPLTVKVSESRKLVDLARAKKRILMVGHVFLFNPGIVKLKELIKARTIGKLYYLHAKRTNLGPVRRDVNAVYDLASHDISIFNYLLEGTPKVLSSTGSCYLQKKIEDVAFISLQYPKNVTAHIHVSWLDPKKTRQITVVGDKKMLTWDDMSVSSPIEIFSKHVEKDYLYYKDFGEFQLKVKGGEVLIPSVRSAEPLREQADHFIQCLKMRRTPLTDGIFALKVVQTLEEIEAVLKKN